MIDKTEHVLDEPTRQLIADFNQQIQNLAVQMNGALALVCRLNGLPGQWRLSPDGTKLVRIDLPHTDATKKNNNATQVRRK